MLQTKFSSVIRCLTKQSRQTWQCRLFSSSSTNSQKVSVDTGDDRISGRPLELRITYYLPSMENST